MYLEAYSTDSRYAPTYYCDTCCTGQSYDWSQSELTAVCVVLSLVDNRFAVGGRVEPYDL